MNAEPRDGDVQDTILMRKDDVAHIRNNCLNRADHAIPPAGYVAGMEWLEKMHETHRQKKCDGCGLWLIWERKT